jgi:hypothetical protein
VRTHAWRVGVDVRVVHAVKCVCATWTVADINDGGWHFIVLAYQLSSATFTVYVDRSSAIATSISPSSPTSLSSDGCVTLGGLVANPCEASITTLGPMEDHVFRGAVAQVGAHMTLLLPCQCCQCC